MTRKDTIKTLSRRVRERGSMAPKEALNNLRSAMKKELNFPLNLTEEYKIINQALTELEELKRVVKRYFDMEEKPCELHEVEEFYDLRDKLMKVGKEE